MARQTYPIYTNSCGWNAMLPPRQARPALTGDQTVDHAVIGAGFTGLAAARRLHEIDDQARIAVVEASEIGEGSSGRNSGFTGAEVLPRNITPEGADRALAQTRLTREAFQWLTDIISDHGIACDLHKAGAIRAAATEAGEASLRNVAKVAKANNTKHIILSGEDILARTGSAHYRFGIYLEDSYLLQPAALIRGLADALPDNVALYENSPVLRLQRDGDAWLLHCREGSLRARNVVLANNSFIPKFGYLKLRMTTIFTYAAVTRRLDPGEQAHMGQALPWGLLPAHRLGTTLRSVGPDRLMVRSLYAHGAELDPNDVTTRLHQRFAQRWPALRHVEFDHVWGGTTAFTMNGAPWWGRLDKGLYASGGCNGSGIAKGTMLGRKLADLIGGIGDPDEVPAVMGTASLIAPEPFRSIGFHVISALESRKAGLEA